MFHNHLTWGERGRGRRERVRGRRGERVRGRRGERMRGRRRGEGEGKERGEGGMDRSSS